MESERLPVPEKSSLLCGAPNRDSLATWVEKYGRSQGNCKRLFPLNLLKIDLRDFKKSY